MMALDDSCAQGQGGQRVPYSPSWHLESKLSGSPLSNYRVISVVLAKMYKHRVTAHSIIIILKALSVSFAVSTDDLTISTVTLELAMPLISEPKLTAMLRILHVY